jgi:hypothetical protein
VESIFLSHPAVKNEFPLHVGAGCWRNRQPNYNH